MPLFPWDVRVTEIAKRNVWVLNMYPTTTDVPGLPAANTIYSQVSTLGDLVFVLGQIGIGPAGDRGHYAG
jgi:hypothetical protein